MNLDGESLGNENSESRWDQESESEEVSGRHDRNNLSIMLWSSCMMFIFTAWNVPFQRILTVDWFTGPDDQNLLTDSKDSSAHKDSQIVIPS